MYPYCRVYLLLGRSQRISLHVANTDFYQNPLSLIGYETYERTQNILDLDAFHKRCAMKP